MELEKQLVSLELAKKLKELGVRQESLFCWCEWTYSEEQDHGQGEIRTDWILEHKHMLKVRGLDVGLNIPAYTVAELGEMLPSEVKDQKDKGYRPLIMYMGQTISPKGWYVTYRDLDPKNDVRHYEYADTEADARAKMLIYLLENELINL